MIGLGNQLIEDLEALETRLKLWDDQSRQKMERVYRRCGVVWLGQMVKRVPVNTSWLKQHLLTNTYWSGQQIITENGTNVRSRKTGQPYAEHLEFGTDRIAKGRVKALGTQFEVTDAQAVHTWAAKEREAITQTSHSYRRIDGGRVLLNQAGRAVSGPQEQMPWLRPAFAAIRDWFLRELNTVLEPPQR